MIVTVDQERPVTRCWARKGHHHLLTHRLTYPGGVYTRVCTSFVVRMLRRRRKRGEAIGLRVKKEGNP